MRAPLKSVGLAVGVLLALVPSTLLPTSQGVLAAYAQTVPDRKAEADRLLKAGKQATQQRQFEVALKHLQAALALYQQLEDRPGEGNALYGLGDVYYYQQDYRQAIRFYQQVLVIRRETGEQGKEALVLNDLGLCHSNRGEKQKALEYHNQALPLLRAMGDLGGEATILTNIGLVYSALGEKAKALQHYNQALPIRRAVGDRLGEAATLNNIGRVYDDLGEKAKALEYYNQVLPLIQAVGDRSGEAATLNNIGSVYDDLGEKAKALEYYNQALLLRRAVGDRGGEARTLNNIGSVYDDLGEKAKALEYYNQALALLRAVGDHSGEAATLNNIGLVYDALGEKAKALEYYNQALPLRRAVGDRSGEATTLNNIGAVCSALGEKAKALEYYNQALPLRRAVGDRSGEATTLNNIGRVYDDLGEKAKALEFFNQALPLYRAVGDRSGEATTLNNIGRVYSALGEKAKALEFFNQALPLLRTVGDRQGEATTLGNIGYVIATQKQPQLAIVFFKQSVSKFESLRANIRQLPKATQETYTKTVAGTYRKLADLLLQQDRILEAQQVLDLLKVQELEDYLRNTRSTTDQALTLRPPEAEILQRHNELQATAIQLGTERAKLSQLNSTTTLTPAQQKRLDQLIQLEEDLNQQFNQFLTSKPIQDLLAQLTTTTQQQTVNLKVLNDLRSNLEKLNAVSLYPLILDDRIELILTTPNTPPIRRTVPVKKAELIPVITAYRDALRRPGNLAETQKLAQQLYDWLIKPIEPELNQAQPQTILYAPDGALRYIPLAALYDSKQPTGKQWLTQRYQVQNITAQSLITNLTTPRSTELNIFAGAFGNQPHTVKVGTTRFDFGGIPFTLKEVAALRQTFPNIRILTEQAFGKTATKREFKSFNVIHLATHGKFVVGEAKNSFILLGNGDTITLPEIENLSLSNVDLVVLSACETGVGDTLGSGTEILGLGYQFQLAGAKAAIASLWQVDDGGTQAMMNVFYTALKAQKSKTAALQIAQQAMIRGEFQSLGITRSDIEVTSTRTNQPIPAAQLSHPYYWAPFILIGNGL